MLPAALPALFSATLSPALRVHLCKCRAAGSASAQTACAIRPTLRQSPSCHGHRSPLPHWLPVSAPSTGLDEGLFFISLVSWCRTSLPLDFLLVLVVRGGVVCLPMPPSWFSSLFLIFILCNSPFLLPLYYRLFNFFALFKYSNPLIG